MNKKWLKLLAFLVAAALIVGVCMFANALNGNPVSKAIATRAAEQYLDERFGDKDYYIERVSYSFKDGSYHAFIKSPTSVDTSFSVTFTMLGEYRYDTYDSVVNKFTTASRLEEEYRALTKTVFDAPSFPYDSDIGYGRLEIYPREAFEDPVWNGVPHYAMIQDDLELDKVYDIRALAAQCGHLIVYVESETITHEKAAEIILDLKALFDEAEIPFVALDFTLWHSLPEEGLRPDGEVRVESFLYEDIYEDSMTERVREADEALRAYYDKLDEQYK